MAEVVVKIAHQKSYTFKRSFFMDNTPDQSLVESLLELIRVTSSTLPADVKKVIKEAHAREKEGTNAKYAMQIINENIALAEKNSGPICQDTGTIIFNVYHPPGFNQGKFSLAAKQAVMNATSKGYLRQNSVDSLTGKNSGNNVGPGHPSLHFHEHEGNSLEVRLMLKGGGCENMGAQYSLPHTELSADRDIVGVRKVILDAVVKAQGKGCGPGILGVAIGGDRGDGYIESKVQLLRKLDDKNPNPVLDELEKDIVVASNKLAIGPMGFGGETTLLGCKIGVLNRLPASYFVSVSYMCWAFRRQGVVLNGASKISKWLY